MGRRALEWSVPVAIVAAVSAGLFSQTSAYGLLGFDAYPIIAASRVESFSDLIGTFTEKLMDGRYAGDFHRPVLNATFAADHALWGLKPFGYQLTNVLLLAACALAWWALARRLLGSRAWIGPVVGLLTFLLSPLVFEVLPVPPRRPELLCGIFMALAIRIQLAPPRLESTRWAVAPAVLTLLAIGSKETAFVLPPLVAIAIAVYSPRAGLRARCLHGLAASVPHFVAAAGMVLVRLVVLGGIGGHESTSIPGNVVVTLWNLSRNMVARMLWPPTTSSPAGHALATVIVLSAIVLATRTRSPGLRNVRRAALFGTAWFAAVVLIYSIGRVESWYPLLPLIGWTLVIGALVEGAFAMTEARGKLVYAIGLAGVVSLILSLAWQIVAAPVVRHYDVWEQATRIEGAYLSDVRGRVEAVPPGSTVEVLPLPYGKAGPAGLSVAMLSDYSLQVWADLALPGRGVRVHYVPGGDGPPAAGDEVVVRVPTFVNLD